MEMNVFKKDDYAGILPVGKMCDLTDYEELKNSIDNVKEEVNTIVIDLSRITFITSQGLGLFISLSKILQDSDKRLILFNPRPDIKKTIEIAGIDLVIKTVYSEEDLEQAVKSDE